jgi:uncharacterized NAD(P)/FAD-binding protein YdhS
MNTVAIIGGGFSGALTAVNLVRLARSPLAVVVFNHGRPLGRGAAYGTARPEHLLNVPARNMSALTDQPDHFVSWLSTRPGFAGTSPADLRELFIPRAVYGDYIEELFRRHAARPSGNGVRVSRVESEVVDVVPAGGRAVVLDSRGRAVEADKVVLATGNPPPGDPDGCAVDHPRYVRDPWRPWQDCLPDPAEDVILLGSGLTAIDAFLTLDALGWSGKVTAVSRRGLLPLPHFTGADHPGFPGEALVGLGLDELLAVLTRHRNFLQGQGIHPAVLVDKLRPFTQRVWQGLPLADKQRFLREFRTPWNMVRHLVPKSAHRRVAAALAAGRLEVVAGRIRGLSAAGGRLRLSVDGGEAGERTLAAGAVINCTGPQESFTASASPLYRNLLARGQATVDDLDLGIRVGSGFAVLQRDGRRSRHLLAMGNLLKGTLWETTAVPELRQQAQRIAELVVGSYARRGPGSGPSGWGVCVSDVPKRSRSLP